MNRFFLRQASPHDGHLELSGDQAHQIRDVLRLREGEQINAFDGDGHEYVVQLTQVSRNKVQGILVGESSVLNEPRTRIILYQSLLKADKFEWVLQKCTELGIAEFVPIMSKRVVAKAESVARRKRWERIVIEAAEQSRRSKIPQLHPVQGLDEALATARVRDGLAIIPWEEENTQDVRSILSRSAEDATVHVFIGPEGGFSFEEIERAQASGVYPVTLGSRILRAETAGLVASTAILFARGDMGVAKNKIEPGGVESRREGIPL